MKSDFKDNPWFIFGLVLDLISGWNEQTCGITYDLFELTLTLSIQGVPNYFDHF